MWIIPWIVGTVMATVIYLLVGGLSEFPLWLKIAWASTAGGATVLIFRFKR